MKFVNIEKMQVAQQLLLAYCCWFFFCVFAPSGKFFCNIILAREMENDLKWFRPSGHIDTLRTRKHIYRVLLDYKKSMERCKDELYGRGLHP